MLRHSQHLVKTGDKLYCGLTQKVLTVKMYCHLCLASVFCTVGGDQSAVLHILTKT